MGRVLEKTVNVGQSAYQGYRLRDRSKPDPELTSVGAGTPCGEYLRRYWHPVALAEDVGTAPLLIRVLGEALVLFRERGGRYGLVNRHCPHRQASMEYGTCEDRGIRCCYHGWLFDVDGTLLETPGQPEEVSRRLCETVQLGAYPTREYKGLVFAYMGPIELEPPFPVFDAYDIPGMTLMPYKAPFRCNWLQVLDAILDPIHTSFLHSRISRVQFSEALGELGVLGFSERGQQIVGTNTRRVGENIWVRVNELIFPNFTQAGAAFATDGTQTRYFGRSSFTRWVVPVDDENTLAIAWGCFGDRGDPEKWMSREGCELIEQGELFDRTYEERQRYPGDAEATEGMGTITVHADEHLAPSDRGVVLMRRRLREAIRELQKGVQPAQPTRPDGLPIRTLGGDTVLRVPLLPGTDDMALLRHIGNKVLEIQMAGDDKPGIERDAWVIEELKGLEQRGGDRL
jgi:nitrite reductase/ring-hydroxylating ferredoxin subunit